MSNHTFDGVPECRRKRQLSDNRKAVNSRAYRKRTKKRVRMALVPIGERDIDAFEKCAGHLDKQDLGAAIRSVLDEWEKHRRWNDSAISFLRDR